MANPDVGGRSPAFRAGRRIRNGAIIAAVALVALAVWAFQGMHSQGVPNGPTSAAPAAAVK